MQPIELQKGKRHREPFRRRRMWHGMDIICITINTILAIQATHKHVAVANNNVNK